MSEKELLRVDHLSIVYQTDLETVYAVNDISFSMEEGETLGLVGVEPEANYVQIAPSTQFADGFTAEDYAALVAKMFNGEVTVSNAIEAMPATSVTVVDAGSIK